MSESIELDHRTLTHMLGYLTIAKWADAIRQKDVNANIAYELLEIQDRQYNGNMADDVKEIVALSDEEYRQWRKEQ